MVIWMAKEFQSKQVQSSEEWRVKRDRTFSVIYLNKLQESFCEKELRVDLTPDLSSQNLHDGGGKLYID